MLNDKVFSYAFLKHCQKQAKFFQHGAEA